MAAISFSDTCEFRPYLPSQKQVSPGNYGFELVLYLSQSLAQRGVITSYPFCHPDHTRGGGSDWFIEYKYTSDLPLSTNDRLIKEIHEDATFTIGVGTQCNDEDGYSDETATNILWHIDIEDSHPVRILSTGTNYRAVKNKLAEIIVEILNTKKINCTCRRD